MNKLVLAFTALWGFQASAASGFYSPQEAIHDALTDNLQYVGSYIPTYSESGLATCVFRGNKVLIRANYCIKGKVQAASLRIHPVDPTRGELEVYAEGHPGDEISELKRDQYFEQSWSVGARPPLNPFSFDQTIAEYQAFDQKEVYSNILGCVSGYTHSAFCSASYSSQLGTWGAQAASFHAQPNDDWYQLLKLIKTKVDALP